MCGFATTGPCRDDDAANAGELYAIYVDPPAWGRGIGRSLTAEARGRLSRQGFVEAVVWVLAGNEQAVPRGRRGRGRALRVHRGRARTAGRPLRVRLPAGSSSQPAPPSRAVWRAGAR
ncbi:MAG: hypothetical protein DLM62_20725 [Pseudonocardiales bacterium]|nr:MAG: hypothetical protein DLM62_20725 [Pseudonocardiales bacterium]